MDDLISRQAAIEALCHIDEYNAKSVSAIKALPSAQQEIKPIGYNDCSNAMMKMWMDNIVTDGEYNRIMDKLNAFWRTRNEQSDKQTGGDRYDR